MAKARITITGDKEAVLKFESLSDEAILKIKAAIFKAGQTIETDAKKAAPVDTGLLRSKIEHRVLQGGLVFEVYPAVDYAAYLEFGTRGGVRVPSEYAAIASQFKGRGNGMPPPDALAGWTKRHGLAGKEWIIARAIQRRGTPARPFLFPAFESQKPEYKAAIRKILQGLR